MIDDSNPAGRLHKILVDARKRSDKDKIEDVWAHVLGVESDEVSVTKAVIELHSLSQEVQSLIKMNPNLNHKLYLHSFRQLEKALVPIRFGAAWADPKKQLSDEALTRLQFCAEQLTDFYSEETLSDEDFESIKAKTEELFEALYHSAIPTELRLTLLEEIERVRSAINLYRIKGAKGLKEALQSTVGAVVVNHDEVEKSAAEHGDVMRRLRDLLDQLDSFTSRALKIKKRLSRPIRSLLESASDPDEGAEGEAS